MIDWVGDPSAALGLTERIAAVGALLATAELLARPRTLRADGLLSWPVARLRSATLAVGPTADVLDRLFATPGVYVLCSGRALGAALIILAPTGSIVSTGGLLLAALASLLLMLRTSYGNDGADQMLLLVLVPSAIVRMIGTQQAIEYALWFIALQCCLAYVTSGLGKLGGRSWPDGTGIIGILNTKTYGMRRVAVVLEQRRWVAVMLSWSVILSEVSFPLVLVAPDPWVPFMLAGGLAFHVVSAVVMGLNSFVWAFGATYPAIAYLAY